MLWSVSLADTVCSYPLSWQTLGYNGVTVSHATLAKKCPNPPALVNNLHLCIPALHVYIPNCQPD
jgi:hypothetical protein